MSQFRKPDNAEPVMSQSVVESEIPQQTEPIEPPTETAEQPVEQTAPEKCPHCGSELKSGCQNFAAFAETRSKKATPVHFHKKYGICHFFGDICRVSFLLF